MEIAFKVQSITNQCAGKNNLKCIEFFHFRGLDYLVSFITNAHNYSFTSSFNQNAK